MGYLIPLYPAKDRYEYSRYPVYVRRRPDMAHTKSNVNLVAHQSYGVFWNGGVLDKQMLQV